MKKGINREKILSVSETLLKNKGEEKLSLREIAAALEVKPASLYNHISGIGEIHEHLAVTASNKLCERLKRAVSGKTPDEAFIAGGKAYRKFAESEPEFYKVLIHSRNSKNKTVVRCNAQSFTPLREVIKSYGGTPEQNAHFLRAFRSFMHGFTEISHNGFMQKGPVSKDLTYETVLYEFLNVLRGFNKNA